MTESERQKMIHDLEYLISVNHGAKRKEYEKQLQEIKKSR